MAVTATLVYARPNHLRYTLDQDGAAGTALAITCTGAASPDLLTDTVAGPLKNLARAATQGFGTFGPGALTSVQVAAMWESIQRANGAGAVNTVIADKTAIMLITPRAGTITEAWIAIAVAFGGNAQINITAQAALTQASLDIIVPGALG